MKAVLVVLLMAFITGCSHSNTKVDLASTHWSDHVRDQIIGCAVLAMDFGQTPEQKDQIYNACLSAVGVSI
ncbi:hypothetical protein FDJ32_gp13 [Pseudomonas phage NV1]|uniref:Lipoprotein n=1 Tax=Pseudomonas phage NV1 TaxID=2079543 RepID=A0A2L0HPM1_9CAUD|nr:hypothetical protein FDJ32_gp13 [Pseudomonas phage NV1]AUX83642.1 hypothetical protein NV1_p13 [Pseudomonas phage NV1]